MRTTGAICSAVLTVSLVNKRTKMATNNFKAINNVGVNNTFLRLSSSPREVVIFFMTVFLEK